MIEHSFNLNKGYVLIIIEGQPTVEDFRLAVERFTGDHEFQPSMDRILDFVNADLNDFTVADFVYATKLINDVPGSQATRTALIAPNFKMDEMFDLFARRITSPSMRVFLRRYQVLQWFEEKEAVDD